MHDGSLRTREGLAENLDAELRLARHALGLSQEEVAHAAGLAVSTYARLERRSTPSNPTLTTLLRVCGVLGVRLSPDSFGRGEL